MKSQTMALVILGFKNWCCQSEVWTPGSKGDMDRAAIGQGPLSLRTSISLFLRAFRSEGETLPHRGDETELPALKQRRAAASRERRSHWEEGAKSSFSWSQLICRETSPWLGEAPGVAGLGGRSLHNWGAGDTEVRG